MAGPPAYLRDHAATSDDDPQAARYVPVRHALRGRPERLLDGLVGPAPPLAAGFASAPDPALGHLQLAARLGPEPPDEARPGRAAGLGGERRQLHAALPEVRQDPFLVFLFVEHRSTPFPRSGRSFIAPAMVQSCRSTPFRTKFESAGVKPCIMGVCTIIMPGASAARRARCAACRIIGPRTTDAHTVNTPKSQGLVAFRHATM